MSARYRVKLIGRCHGHRHGEEHSAHDRRDHRVSEWSDAVPVLSAAKETLEFVPQSCHRLLVQQGCWCSTNCPRGCKVGLPRAEIEQVIANCNMVPPFYE
jgi:hypothetical protein